MLQIAPMTMRALAICLTLSFVCAACTSVSTPCRSQVDATGTGSSVTQAEARVTWKSGGCSGQHP